MLKDRKAWVKKRKMKKSISSHNNGSYTQIFVCRYSFVAGRDLACTSLESSGSYSWIWAWLLFQKFTAKHLMQNRGAPLQISDLDNPAKVLLPFQPYLSFPCSPSLLTQVAHLSDIKPTTTHSWPRSLQANWLMLFLGSGGKTVKAGPLQVLF